MIWKFFCTPIKQIEANVDKITFENNIDNNINSNVWCTSVVIFGFECVR
jgi:hypothetical protein